MRSRTIAVLVTILGLAAASCSQDPEKAKQQYMASGDSYVAQKKYPEAIVEYRNAVARDARFGEARFKLADAYEQTGNLRDALREFVRAADLMPDNVEAQIRAGKLLIVAGQFPEAKSRALAGLAKDPKSVQSLILLGNALIGMKDIDGAIAQVEAAIDADPQLTFTYANLGALEMRKGDKAAAEAAFKRALEIDPKAVVGHLNLGNFYWATGDRAKAEVELKAAFAIDPNSAAVNRFLGAFYTLGGRAKDAEPYLKTLAAVTTNPAYKMVLIDYYLGTKRIDEAVKMLEPLAQQKDSMPAAKLRLAALDFTSNKRPHAYQTLEEILAQFPNHERTLEAKTRFLIFDRRFGEAVKLADATIKANPQAARSHFLRGLALEGTGSLEEALKAFQRVLELAPKATVAQLQIASIHIARGNGKTALDYAGQAVKEQPRSLPAHFLLGQALLISGNIKAAEAELGRIVKATPSSPEAQTWLGRLYLAKNDYVRARSTFTRVVEMEPDSFMALNGLVSIDLAEKKWPAARARLEARLAKTPNDVPILYMAGNSYLTMGDQPRGEALLRKVVELAPTNMAAYGQLARLYLKQQRLDAAKADIEAAIKKQAKPAGATTLVGLILEMQNKPAEARKYYEQALAMDPNAGVAANNLAWQYAESGDNLDTALKLAQTAKSKLPDNAQVTDTLGWVYYKKGLTSLAITTLLEGAKQGPTAPSIHYHLGLAYLKSGNRDDAQRSLERALKLNGQFKGAENAKQVLASLRG